MMIEGSGSGSIHLTSGSGSGRPKNMWIRWVRIHNTGHDNIFLKSLFWCREEIISQEVARIQPIGRSQQIIQLFTSHPWIRQGGRSFFNSVNWFEK
jgi:hypothetical protein